MKPYDNYEISPCRRFEEPDAPGQFWFEVCEPDEADVWTLFGHIEGEGVDAIGDFASREAAENTYARITGQPFPGSYQCDAHIRRMHLAEEAYALLRRASNELEIWQLGCGPDGDPDTVMHLRGAKTLFETADVPLYHPIHTPQPQGTCLLHFPMLSNQTPQPLLPWVHCPKSACLATTRASPICLRRCATSAAVYHIIPSI